MRLVLIMILSLLPMAGIAGTSIDMGDLDVGSARIPPFYPAAGAEAGYLAAKQWPEYDATCRNAPCPSGRLGIHDAPGNPMSACNPANPADDGGEEWAHLKCMANSAPDFSVIFIPAGTYDMGDAHQEVIKISRSNVVLRGAGITKTHLRLAHTVGGRSVTGSANCGDSDFSSGILCGAGVVSVGTNFEGSARAWTSGYAEEATKITLASTSGLEIGGWILLEIDNARDDCKKFLPEPVQDLRNMNHALTHISKISNISGNQVTLDRGLRMDYAADPGCTDTAQARPYNPIRWVGLENIHFVTAPSVNPDLLKNEPFASFGGGTVESWAVGNKFERAEARIFLFRASARNWFQGNKVENYGRIDSNYNTSGVTNANSAVDNVIENNAWKDYVVGVYNLQGAEGGVVAYNYMRHGSPPNNPERALFNHGLYTREFLFEGNDVDGMIVTGDHWWGPNGGRLTVFRNRNVATHSRGGVVMNRDKSGPWDIADRVNWIGNIAAFYYSTPGCADWPDCMGSSRDFDGDGGMSSANTTNMHIEKNIFRNNKTCTGDKSPNRCGFHQDTPSPDTSCGTAAGPGDCEGGTGDNAGGEAAPADWAGDQAPHSLYRPGTTPPIWWCDEACSWDDVHNGVGAWGDDFDRTLCKLPAQILAEGGTCTPVDCEGDCTAPSISITSPASGATLTGSVTFSADAADASGIESVALEIVGNDMTTDSSAPYTRTFDSNAYPDGTYILRAKAVDSSARNNEALRTISVVIDNVPVVCGDNVCEAGETTASCAQDCPVCLTSDGAFQNTAFQSQSGSFTAEYDAIPNAGGLDTLVMLSKGAGSTFDDYAVLIRFSSDGTVEVRNGDVYSADLSLPYSSGTTYRFRVDVDVAAHTYSVYVTPQGSSEQALATGYAFRTSQAAVTELDHWAVQSNSGSHDTCSFILSGGGSGRPAPPVMLP